MTNSKCRRSFFFESISSVPLWTAAFCDKNVVWRVATLRPVVSRECMRENFICCLLGVIHFHNINIRNGRNTKLLHTNILFQWEKAKRTYCRFLRSKLFVVCIGLNLMKNVWGKWITKCLLTTYTLKQSSVKHLSFKDNSLNLLLAWKYGGIRFAMVLVFHTLKYVITLYDSNK